MTAGFAKSEEYDKWAALEKALRGSDMDFEADIVAVARLLGLQLPLLREVYGAYQGKQEVFENKPRIGAKLRVDFDWEQQRVKIRRSEQQGFDLELEHFLAFLGIVDACCTPIYPVGTVVELDVDMLPETVQGMFREKEPGALVTLTGRKIPLDDKYSDYVIDYLGRLWPFGEMPGSNPIVVSNMMIRRVVYLGLSNEWEERFAARVLRTGQLKGGRLSMAFATEDVLEELGKVAVARRAGNFGKGPGNLKERTGKK